MKYFYYRYKFNIHNFSFFKNAFSLKNKTLSIILIYFFKYTFTVKLKYIKKYLLYKNLLYPVFLVSIFSSKIKYIDTF